MKYCAFSFVRSSTASLPESARGAALATGRGGGGAPASRWAGAETEKVLGGSPPAERVMSLERSSKR